MKTIRNLVKQDICLENFGVIEIEEMLDGTWCVDLTPHGCENNIENISIKLPKHEGGRYIRPYKDVVKNNLN